MALNSGQRLGPYEVVSSIGAGGMGEVYRARDPRLGRDVAIKVLPTEVASEPERLQRFEREARAASALNHPNIVTVHDVGKEGSIAYMAIELIDGKTLRDLLQEGPLPVRKLLDFAVQIADGLAAAHDAGIIHRDLKPRNIMVSRTGFVKILDFGLAKGPVSPLATSETASETVTTPATDPGLLLGTTEYMSPEQVRGKTLDFRSDQFSFGATLYEMATGRRAFSRETRADTMTAILQQEPTPIAQLRPEVPAPLRWIIDRCLSKSAADRYASTSDLARELQSLREHLSEISGEQALPPGPRSRRRVTSFAVAAGALTAAVALWLAWSGQWHHPVEPHFHRLTFRRGVVSRALFAPNSRSILYSATWEGESPRTFLKLPDSTSLDRSLDAETQVPMAYSEDASQVLVVLGPRRASKDLLGTLAWWPALGGKARPVLENTGWADWSGRTRHLAVVRDTGTERRIEVRNADGGLERTVFRTTGGISFLRFSPREDYIAFFHHAAVDDPAGEIRVVTPDGKISRALTPRFAFCRGLAWNAKSGEIWFTISGDGTTAGGLKAVSLSGNSRSLYSLPGDFVLQDVSAENDLCLMTSSESRTALMVRPAGGDLRELSWLNQTFVTDISPDEKFLLFYDGGLEVPFGSWMRSVEGGDAIRLGEWEEPKFSPDGKWIVALTPTRIGPPQILLHPNGPGETRQLTASPASHWSPSFAGPRTIVFTRVEGNRKEIWRMETDGTGSRSLAAGCDTPMANPGANSFVCIGGQDHRSLLAYPLEGGPGRIVYELRAGELFRYARWSGDGSKILAVTDRGRLLTLDGWKPVLLSEERLALPGTDQNATLSTAALTTRGTLQAYSVGRFASTLYLVAGLR